MAFGIDDLIGGLVGGGIKMFANSQQNDANWDQNVYNALVNVQEAQRSRDFSAQQAEIMRQFNNSESAATWQRNLASMRENQDWSSAQADVARQFSAGQQTKAEQFNANQAQLNRDFQNQQTSTAYQRAMADMKTAGLNPILAYRQGGAGSGAGGQGSVGPVSGPMASVGNASSSAASSGIPGSASASVGAGHAPVAALQGALGSAMEAAKFQPVLGQLKEQEKLTAADEDLRRSQAHTERERAVTQRAETELKRSQKELTDEQTKNEPRRQGTVAGVNVPYWTDQIRPAASRVIGDVKRSIDETSNSAWAVKERFWPSNLPSMIDASQ